MSSAVTKLDTRVADISETLDEKLASLLRSMEALVTPIQEGTDNQSNKLADLTAWLNSLEIENAELMAVVNSNKILTTSFLVDNLSHIENKFSTLKQSVDMRIDALTVSMILTRHSVSVDSCSIEDEQCVTQDTTASYEQNTFIMHFVQFWNILTLFWILASK